MYRKLVVRTCDQCPCLDNGKCCLEMSPNPDGCSVVIIRGSENGISKRQDAPPYIRSGRKYSPDEIVPMISRPTAHSSWSAKRELLDGDLVNIRSSRLATFKKSLRCVCCGLEGSFFIKEKHRRIKDPDSMPFHLNLYAIDANRCEVLMTSDHVIPKSKALSGLRDNRQTMCSRCNQAKGCRNITIEKLRKELFGKDGARKLQEAECQCCESLQLVT